MVASIEPQRDEVGLVDGRMLIGGEWVAAASGITWCHTHPATGEQVASFPVAGAADVDLAVRAARRAFDEGPWPRVRAGERGRTQTLPPFQGGDHLVFGGTRGDGDLAAGNFVMPTLFADVSNDMTIAREEIQPGR